MGERVKAGVSWISIVKLTAAAGLLALITRPLKQVRSAYRGRSHASPVRSSLRINRGVGRKQAAVIRDPRKRRACALEQKLVQLARRPSVACV